MLTALLLAHAAATLAMTGLIWFVQVVHYPLLECVGADGFVRYERRHVQRTTLVVGPLMLVELATSLTLAIVPPPGLAVAAWTGLGLVALLWLSTALVQVPCHRRLERGWDAPAARRLVATNWLRTAAWSARSGIAILLLLPAGS